MKYHIVFKFIAVILCAAALLGAVGSAAGIAVLTGLGLYDKTVDQVYEDRVEQLGGSWAHEFAMAYASRTLGGCPEAMLEQQYNTPYYQYGFTYGHYNLILRDADGNVLDTSETTELDTVSYLFPVSGKYEYFLSAVPESEKYPETSDQEDPVEETIRLEAEPTLETGAPMLLAEDEVRSNETAPAETAPPETAPPETEEAEETLEETAETVPEETAETVPSETEETEEAPEETTPSETAPPETVAETLPPETVGPVADSSPAEGTPDIPTDSQPGQVLVNGRPVTDFEIRDMSYYDYHLGEQVYVEYVLLDMPEYTVELQLAPGAMNLEPYMPLLRVLRHYRDNLLPALAVSLLLFAAFGVYLCCAAGRGTKDDGVRAGGLNRMPLEIYAAVVVGIVGLLMVGGVEGGDYLLREDTMVGCTFVTSLAYLTCLVLVGFIFALVAQFKAPDWFWLRNSLCGRCLRLAGWLWHKFLSGSIRFARVLESTIFPFLGRLLMGLWNLVVLRFLGAVWSLISRCFRYLAAKVEHFIGLLPLTWQWLVTGVALVLILALLCGTGSAVGVFIALILTIGAVLVGSNAFGMLLESTRRMSRGDLNARIDESKLFGCFKDFARNLNALANVAVVAANRQLKSERMKTELITNVSHDIKTPLTSIINYVDLLQKAGTEEEREQYLEVLSRQSQQLKKLIEDLIEMSKASTGNMSVEITQLDAVEAVNQALGEFSDKLEKAQLTPIFRHSEESAPMMADGKLAWRVLHNLLSNAVKYALPGTRLYIDLMVLEGKVILSMKNVSRDELNVDAEELMERFVRGDGSRNTEGSGLGLNIAKSLMELQKGSLQLLVDGDLFKVTLIFPGA